MTATPDRAVVVTEAPTPPGDGLSVTLLGTNGGPPPLADRYGISSVVTVAGRSYVVDCGRGAVSQFVRAGLSTASLSGIFLTHLHADHVVDYFAFPLLCAGLTGPRGYRRPLGVWGPGPAGRDSLAGSAPGLVPGTVGMTDACSRAYAAHATFFLAEGFGADPASTLQVHDVLPPAAAGASSEHPCPDMEPFPVVDDGHVRVSAVLVPHGSVFPAYAYRFDTAHGSVVFSGDTARSANLVRLARGADILVHEVAAFEALAELPLPPALATHIREVHTDVTELGGIAVDAGVTALVTNHFSPGDLGVMPEERWRKLLDESMSSAGFPGMAVLGSDLMTISLGPQE